MPTCCGASVDIQMALGDDDIVRNDTLRRGERPRASYAFGPVGAWSRLSVWYGPASLSPSATQVSTDVP